MRSILALVIAVCFIAIPFTVLRAEIETVLAYEETPFVFEDQEQLNKLVQDLVKKTIRKGEKHPCVVKARSEEKDINVLMRVGNTETGMIFVKIIATDC